MKYGLSKSQMDEIAEMIAGYPEIDEAVLFGSRAIDTYKEASDVDIAIKGEKVTASLAAKLKDHFEEETYLPFFFDVVAYKSIKSEELKQHIKEKGEKIYSKGASGWKECKLGAIVTFQRGFDITKKEQFSGSYPVVSSSGVNSYHNAYKVRCPGVVIGRKGTLGTVFYMNKDFWPHDTTLWVKNFHGNHPLFIAYFLKEFDFQQYDVGSSNPTLNRNHIHLLLSLIPPLPEQKAIASVLSSLDDKIDLLHRQNKTLEAMAETLFRQWFIEPSPNLSQRERDIESQGEWEKGELSYFAENPKNSVKPIDIEADTRYIGLEHIDRRNIALIQAGSASEVSSNKYQFVENDILFGKLRPYFHKVCFAPYEGVCSTDILVIRPKRPHYFAYCLFAFFQDAVVEYANLGSEGTRMPRTNWEMLSQYSVQIPDEETLKRFNQLIAPSIEKNKQNQNQIQTLEKLRDTLLPKLISGEVRVAYEN